MQGTQNERDRAIDKLAKLLEKQKSTTEAEAAAIAEKVQEWLQKYNLDMSEIILNKKEGSEIKQEYTKLGGVRNWRKRLVSVIARNMFCEAILLGQGKDMRVAFIGRKQDIETVRQLYIRLEEQMNELADEAYWECYKGSGVNWKESFFIGMVDRLNERLREKFNAFAEANGKALVVATNDAIDVFIATTYTHLHHSTYRQKIHSFSAYDRGVQAGDKLRIHEEIQ